MRACLSGKHFVWINSLNPHNSPSRKVLPAPSPLYRSKNSSTGGLSNSLKSSRHKQVLSDSNQSGLIINHYITVLCLFYLGKLKNIFISDFSKFSRLIIIKKA